MTLGAIAEVPEKSLGFTKGFLARTPMATGSH